MPESSEDARFAKYLADVGLTGDDPRVPDIRTGWFAKVTDRPETPVEDWQGATYAALNAAHLLAPGQMPTAIEAQAMLVKHITAMPVAAGPQPPMVTPGEPGIQPA